MEKSIWFYGQTSRVETPLNDLYNKQTPLIKNERTTKIQEKKTTKFQHNSQLIRELQLKMLQWLNENCLWVWFTKEVYFFFYLHNQISNKNTFTTTRFHWMNNLRWMKLMATKWFLSGFSTIQFCHTFNPTHRNKTREQKKTQKNPKSQTPIIFFFFSFSVPFFVCSLLIISFFPPRTCVFI